MAKSFLPPSDAGLLAWSANFNSLINSGATAYGLTTALATAYGTLHTAYATGLAACEPSIRTRSAIATKNAARTALKNDAKLLANLVNGTASVTNAQKLALGLSIRSGPSPIPPPSTSPVIEIISTLGFTVRIRLRDSSGAKRGKPPGTTGASVFTYTGDTAPADFTKWTFQGNTGRVTKIDITLPGTTVAGAKVWLTAFWFNGRKQSGAACTPVGVNLPGGGVAMAA